MPKCGLGVGCCMVCLERRGAGVGSSRACATRPGANFFEIRLIFRAMDCRSLYQAPQHTTGTLSRVPVHSRDLQDTLRQRGLHTHTMAPAPDDTQRATERVRRSAGGDGVSNSDPRPTHAAHLCQRHMSLISSLTCSCTSAISRAICAHGAPPRARRAPPQSVRSRFRSLSSEAVVASA